MISFTLHQVACSSILLLLIIAVAYHIFTAFITGSISFGYKYYPPGQGCSRKESPVTFYSIVAVYGLSIAGCLSLVIFILTHPIA